MSPRTNFSYLFVHYMYGHTYGGNNMFNILLVDDNKNTRRLMEKVLLQTVDVHINRLRERFKTNEDFEIITVRGLGYKAVKKYEAIT